MLEVVGFQVLTSFLQKLPIQHKLLFLFNVFDAVMK